MLTAAIRIYDAQGEVLVLEGETKMGRIPVGVVAVGHIVQPEETPRAEPHVEWFPWASPRNKVETALRCILDLSKDHLVLTNVREGEDALMRHICRYGAMRCVGHVRSFYLAGENRRALLFQSVRD